MCTCPASQGQAGPLHRCRRLADYIAAMMLTLSLALSFNADAHSEPGAVDSVSAQPGSPFDADAALAVSQAVIGRQLGDHALIDSAGAPASLESLRGKPMVVSLVYTSCYQVCPLTTRHLSEMVDKARAALGTDSFNVVLVGFDTPVDTPAAMRYFADQQGISDKGWHLYSGDKAAIDALASDLGFLYFPAAHGFDHLLQTSIIDAEGRVYRQVYGQLFETPLLVEPLIELVLGRAAPKQPLWSGLFSKIKLFCTTYDPARDGYFFDYSLFLGMLIGGSIIIFAGTIVVRGLQRS